MTEHEPIENGGQETEIAEHPRTEVDVASVFLVNGTIYNWACAERLGYWGLPSRGVPFRQGRARLQEAGFGSASVILAVAGPLMLYAAVVDGDVYFDDTPIFDKSTRAEAFAFRFRLTRVRRVEGPWFREGSEPSWRAAVTDVFFEKKGLLRLRRQALHWPSLDATALRSAVVGTPTS